MYGYWLAKVSFKWPGSHNVSLCSVRSEVVELILINNITNKTYYCFRKAAWRSHPSMDVRNIVCYFGYLQWSAWGTCHFNLIVLIRNRTISAYVVLQSWLSGPLLPWLQVVLSGEELWRQGCSSREEEGGTWELYHSHFLTKSTFFSKLQTAAVIVISAKKSHDIPN